jgi:hypothetical protein
MVGIREEGMGWERMQMGTWGVERSTVTVKVTVTCVAMLSMLSMELCGRSSPRASLTPLEESTPRFSRDDRDRTRERNGG